MTIDSTSTNTSTSEALSPGELAYFNSGGADTSLLDQEISGSTPPETPPAPAPQDGEPQGDEDGIDGEIVIDSNGRAKDRTTGRFVPHGAFAKERSRRKEVETELTTTREKLARVDERLALLNDILGQNEQGKPQGQEQEDETPPDPEKDIFGFVRWQAKMIEKLQNNLNEGTRKTEQRETEQRLQQVYSSDIESFKAKNEDFVDAAQHLVNGRVAELNAAGITDPNQVRSIIAREERELVQNAISNQLSPAQVIYNIAKARGYAPKAKEAAPKQDDPAKKIEAIAKGQKVAGASLSAAGGSSGEGLTAEALANMSEAEFAATISKLSKAQQRALFGG